MYSGGVLWSRSNRHGRFLDRTLRHRHRCCCSQLRRCVGSRRRTCCIACVRSSVASLSPRSADAPEPVVSCSVRTRPNSRSYCSARCIAMRCCSASARLVIWPDDRRLLVCAEAWLCHKEAWLRCEEHWWSRSSLIDSWAANADADHMWLRLSRSCAAGQCTSTHRRTCRGTDDTVSACSVGARPDLEGPKLLGRRDADGPSVNGKASKKANSKASKKANCEN